MCASCSCGSEPILPCFKYCSHDTGTDLCLVCLLKSVIGDILPRLRCCKGRALLIWRKLPAGLITLAVSVLNKLLSNKEKNTSSAPLMWCPYAAYWEMNRTLLAQLRPSSKYYRNIPQLPGEQQISALKAKLISIRVQHFQPIIPWEIFCPHLLS